MSVLLVIPARYASTRFPGKPLAGLIGAGGESKSLIKRSWEAAIQAKGVDRVLIATDDQRIVKAAQEFGAETVMTATECRNGTERCADALVRINEEFDLIINLQGDAPLTPPWFVENLIQAMNDHPLAQVATPVLRCDHVALNNFQNDRKNNRVGGTTVVFDRDMRALYFSKEVLPYTGRDFTKDEVCPVFHHVGVYAYRPKVLANYPHYDEGALEKWEGLEQLRFMEHGQHVLCVKVDGRGRSFWELNNPEDVPRIETMLQTLGIQ